MKDSNNKRPILMAIYRVLVDYSDENHPLTQDEISELILKYYNVESTRLTVKNNLDILENVFNIELINIPNQGVYLEDRLITESEMKFLSDAIYAYGAIHGTYANDLVKKLSNLFSSYKRDNFVHNHYATERIRKKDKNFLFKLETIDKAIQEKKKISFSTFTYDEQGQRKSTHSKEFKIIASPYYTISNMGRHYLIYKSDKFNNLSSSRIEYMEDKIEILDDNIVPIKTVDPSFNISDFMNTQNYMFSSNIIEAKIKLYNESAIRDAKDWFGDNAIISYDCDNQEVYAKIKSDEQGLIYWCMQYSDYLEIVEPLKTRNRMMAYTNRVQRNYSKKISSKEIADFKTILNDSMSSLRFYNNLDKLSSKEIIENIRDRINDFTSLVYSIKIIDKSIILTKDKNNITINISFLEDDPNETSYFNLLNTLSSHQKESNTANKIIDLFLSNNKGYYLKNDAELSNYIGGNIKIDNNIKYSEKEITFNKPINEHWNSIIKYANINTYKYVIIEY